MKLEEIKKVISENIKEGKQKYEGLCSSDIGIYNRYIMFGDMSSEDFDDDEWSVWVD